MWFELSAPCLVLARYGVCSCGLYGMYGGTGYYADPEKELDHGFYKNTLPLTVQMLQEVGTLCTQNGQENI